MIFFRPKIQLKVRSHSLAGSSKVQDNIIRSSSGSTIAIKIRLLNEFYGTLCHHPVWLGLNYAFILFQNVVSIMLSDSCWLLISVQRAAGARHNYSTQMLYLPSKMISKKTSAPGTEPCSNIEVGTCSNIYIYINYKFMMILQSNQKLNQVFI